MKSRLFRTSPGLLLLLGMSAGPVVQAQGPKPASYTIIDIRTLGGTNSFAYSNNDAGFVAGGANTSGQNDLVAQTGFLWYGGQPINLGTLGGAACPGCSSQGAAASANGNVAMLSETATSNGPNGEDFCEYRTHRQCLAAVWKNGTLTALPKLPGGNNSVAFFANSRGEIVGTSETGVNAPANDLCATPFQVQLFEATKWSPDGVISPLRPLDGDSVSFAFMINDIGQAVGMSGLCSNVVLPPFVGPSAPHAVLWDPNGTPHEIGPPPGSAGVLNIAPAINDRGQVAMNSLMLDGTLHAFLWTDGVLQDLGTFPQDSAITVVPCCNNVNNRGQIVGFSLEFLPDGSANQRALFWANANQAPVDLNSLVPADSPWYLFSPGGINDAGEIAVTAVNLNTFEVHAVVATPIKGVGPAARGATKPPVLPADLQKALLRRMRF